MCCSTCLHHLKHVVVKSSNTCPVFEAANRFSILCVLFFLVFYMQINVAIFPPAQLLNCSGAHLFYLCIYVELNQLYRLICVPRPIKWRGLNNISYIWYCYILFSRLFEFFQLFLFAYVNFSLIARFLFIILLFFLDSWTMLSTSNVGNPFMVFVHLFKYPQVALGF